MRPWSEFEEEELKRLLGVGLSWSEIARRIGRSRNSVAGKINRLGMIENPTGPRVRPKRQKPRVWDTNHGTWDSRTFLPYAEWRKWHRNRLKERENVEV